METKLTELNENSQSVTYKLDKAMAESAPWGPLKHGAEHLLLSTPRNFINYPTTASMAQKYE